MEQKNDLKKAMRLRNSLKIFFFSKKIKEKKQKWSLIKKYFVYKKPIKNVFYKYKRNIFFFQYNIFISLLKKFYKSGNADIVLKNINTSFFLLKNQTLTDSFWLYLSFLDSLRIPFLLRSKKVAGRAIQIPMLASIDSQYNYIFRVLNKQTKMQSYFKFYIYLLYHLKLSSLHQSYIFNSLTQTTITAFCAFSLKIVLSSSVG